MSKILIMTNHSYMLYRFRLELIQEMRKAHEVVLSMPFVGHEEDFQALGIRCIQTEVDRRGMNPKTDFRLFLTYRELLKAERPDMVITYSIKPNVYGGLACRMAGVPYCANVQGLGTAFQKKGLARLVTVLYKLALGKAHTVFFENEANAAEFRSRKIVPAEKETVLPGAGINLERYPYVPYPENQVMHFLYLGRLMKEKGIDELFAAMERLHERGGSSVILDLVGFYDDESYKGQVERLVARGIAVYHGFQTDPLPYYAAADCVVLPSYHEGMSNVLLEAARRWPSSHYQRHSRLSGSRGRMGKQACCAEPEIPAACMRRCAVWLAPLLQNVNPWDRLLMKKWCGSLTRDGSFPLPYLRLLELQNDKARLPEAVLL